jgi:hypothetical protein
MAILRAEVVLSARRILAEAVEVIHHPPSVVDRSTKFDCSRTVLMVYVVDAPSQSYHHTKVTGGPVAQTQPGIRDEPLEECACDE